MHTCVSYARFVNVCMHVCTHFRIFSYACGPAPSTFSPCCRCGISPKKLLIPMSFATVLGGTCTLIGTSTNLVVSGLQLEKYGTSNPEYVFGFFTITPWGIPYAVWGRSSGAMPWFDKLHEADQHVQQVGSSLLRLNLSTRSAI